MSGPWIHVVGIGEDGWDGLGRAARTLVSGAELLVGGERHLAMLPPHAAPRLTWEPHWRETFARMEGWRGKRVVVLASGDPLCYGMGGTLLKQFAPEDLFVLPVPGAFSLACARLKWSMPDTRLLTVHGRPLEILHAHLAPHVRLLVLSRDGDTPAAIARLLTERGFGPSTVSVLESLGGPRERRLDGTAETWNHPRCGDLNTVAVDCRAGAAPRALPLSGGLPDEWFEHDGQLTKREVRAVTLSTLAPLPGQTLWDIGAGCGSIAIEWLRLARDGRAVAVEKNAERAARIARNALALGVPDLEVRGGEAAALLDALPAPDTVFIGGGLAVMEPAWQRLPSGGRLVANGVTVEAEARLVAFRQDHGGGLIRIAVSREEGLGKLTALKPLAPVLHYCGVKP